MTIASADVENKILKQVEFYFGDSNLPRDKFLLEKVRENEEGWVSLEIISTFSRMKKLSEDCEVIKNALSGESLVIEMNEDKTMVRRREPLPEGQETLSRSVYVKGFPTTATLDDIQECLEQYSTLIQAIRLRRVPKSGEFKGSVFVEFPTEEEANRFATLSISFKDTPLIVKTKLVYFEEKNAERTGKKSNPKAAALLERMGRGRLLKIEPFPAEGITHETLKETLKDSFPVAYVDFSYEAGCAWLRFKEAAAEQFAAEYNKEKPLCVGEHKLTCFVAADESAQLKYYEETMIKARGGHAQQNKRSGGNKRAKPEDHDEAVVEETRKVVKTEEVAQE